MDPSYAMAKFGLESKDILRSRQKGCWYYMKYFFIFSSIIQFLIILGLVLFMLYGNAHGGTELRLKSVENRYKNLTVDHALLKGNVSLLKEKLALAEKNMKNCSDIVVKMNTIISNMNKTGPCPRPPPPNNCINLQVALNHLNVTCNNERLKAENYRILMDFKLHQLNENCSKTTTECATKSRLATSENIQLQRDKEDLESQIKLHQASCTAIEKTFGMEVQNLKTVIENAISSENPYDSTATCRRISDLVIKRIESTLVKLRQDVNIFVYENSQLQVTKARINADLEKCIHDKNIVTSEKNNLAEKKASIEKDLGTKKDELYACQSQYLKKDAELASCQKPPMRPPVLFPPLRT